jgi:signal transduction histidine kinase
VKAFDLGAVDYITKPFQTEEVLARVRTQLALRRQMKLSAEKKKMETLLTLIGGIAHRFNNQLYVVKGNLDLMQGDEELPAKMTRFLEPAANAAEEIAELTRRLLIFTTYDRPEPEPTLLNRYISSRLATLKSTLPPGIRVETRFSEEDLPVRVDPSRMETVLSEVVENSREAMADEKGLIRITTQRLDPDPARTDPETGEPFGPMARIAVADDGTGMDEATRERVFDPFFSTKFLGRGMSMAAVQGIVRGHGGFVSVISAPGRGTVVHLDLPLDGQSLS